MSYQRGENSMKSEPIQLKNVEVSGGFWERLSDLARDVIIPYQWDVMNDRVKGVPKSGVMRNYRIAAGKAKGDFTGYRFQDSDFGKWLEAVAYRLLTHPDRALERVADRAIDLVAGAQDDDGYLNTFYTVKDRHLRWTNLRDQHEMYVAGHLLEGAIAYFEATGKRKFLDVMIRNVEHIAHRFGPGKGQQRGYPGHQELELALVKLHRLTGNEEYLRLAKFFIDERGRTPAFYEKERKARGETSHWTDPFKGEYFQVHRPVREQKEAVGHAVRAMYMYSGMADVAAETRDASLVRSLKTLWRNVVDRRMYVIGGVGSASNGEAFTYDYDLPNETAYAETCAAIGLVFWAQRMLRLDVDREYADVMERALYNNVISGVSLDGRHFFYANPLAAHPDPRHPGKNLRPGWYGCACCPPNLARLMTSLGSYVYGQSGRTLYTHLFVDSTAEFAVGHMSVKLVQKTEYPSNEEVRVDVMPGAACRFSLAVRIPGWCRRPLLKVNGKGVQLDGIMRKGYAIVDRTWRQGDRVGLTLPMPVERVYTPVDVRMNAGRVALQRGPVVYCLEEADNGKNLNALELPVTSRLAVKGGSVNGVSAPFVEAQAIRLESPSREGLGTAAPEERKVRMVAVPYHLWANRGEGEMQVWIRERRLARRRAVALQEQAQ